MGGGGRREVTGCLFRRASRFAVFRERRRSQIIWGMFQNRQPCEIFRSGNVSFPPSRKRDGADSNCRASGEWQGLPERRRSRPSPWRRRSGLTLLSPSSAFHAPRAREDAERVLAWEVLLFRVPLALGNGYDGETVLPSKLLSDRGRGESQTRA